jgi:hypothetical protein
VSQALFVRGFAYWAFAGRNRVCELERWRRGSVELEVDFAGGRKVSTFPAEAALRTASLADVRLAARGTGFVAVEAYGVAAGEVGHADVAVG